MNVGDVLEGRFQIERVAGKGGAGIVYRGIDRDTGAPVARPRPSPLCGIRRS